MVHMHILADGSTIGTAWMAHDGCRVLPVPADASPSPSLPLLPPPPSSRSSLLSPSLPPPPTHPPHPTPLLPSPPSPHHHQALFSGTLSRALFRESSRGRTPCLRLTSWVALLGDGVNASSVRSTVTSRWRSIWSWQRPSTTARSRWRRREREWSTRSTSAFGHRNLHSQGSALTHGRLRGCPRASPLHTVAGGHCYRHSGRPHGDSPPPGLAEGEGGGGMERSGTSAPARPASSTPGSTPPLGRDLLVAPHRLLFQEGRGRRRKREKEVPFVFRLALVVRHHGLVWM